MKTTVTESTQYEKEIEIPNGVYLVSSHHPNIKAILVMEDVFVVLEEIHQGYGKPAAFQIIVLPPAALRSGNNYLNMIEYAAQESTVKNPELEEMYFKMIKAKLQQAFSFVNSFTK